MVLKMTRDLWFRSRTNLINHKTNQNKLTFELRSVDFSSSPIRLLRAWDSFYHFYQQPLMIGFKDGVMWKGLKVHRTEISRSDSEKKAAHTRTSDTDECQIEVFCWTRTSNYQSNRRGVKVHSISTNVCVLTIRTLEGSKVELDIFDLVVLFLLMNAKTQPKKRPKKYCHMQWKREGWLWCASML